MTAALRCRLIATGCLLLAAVLLGSCGGKGKGLPDEPQAGQPAPSIGQPPAALPVLPRPLEIPRAASAPPTDSDLYRGGSQDDTLLPHQRAMSKTSDMEFTPDWDLGDVATPDRLAYAGYRFTNLAEYAGMARVKLSWSHAPAAYEHLYLAVADFSHNAWRWYQVPGSDYVDLAAFGDSVSAGGELFALVLLAGTASADLRWIMLGDRLSPVASMVTDLSLDKALNVAPLTVSFDARGSSVTGGEIVLWDFDFEDDGGWDELGDEDGQVQHTYSDPGATTCRLRVHDDVDQQDETTVDFWVVNPANVAPTAHYTATPGSGTAPLAVDLDASTTTDDTGIQRYEWDLEGDGLFETDTGTSPQLSHIFGVNGTTTVALMVTDDDYATHLYTAPVTVSSGFGHAVVASGYNIARPMSAATSGTGVNQRACVAWQDFGEKDLKFSIATDINSNAYAAPVDPVATEDNTGYSPALICPGAGNPMIAFGEYPGDHKFDLFVVRATDLSGSAWDSPVAIGVDQDTGGENALANVFGKPSIVSVANAGTQGSTSLYFYQATDGTGSSWSAGQQLLDGPATGRISGLSIIGAIIGFFEVPVVSYLANASDPEQHDVGVIRGMDQTGSTWNTPVVMTDRTAWSTSLAMVAGYPALVAGSSASGASLYYGRAGDVAGDTWPDGIAELLGGGYGGDCDLALVDGVPAICFHSYTGGDLWYMDAADATGTSWNDPYTVASSGIVGQHCSMTVINYDTPVIFYYDSDNDNLMAAYWVP